MTFAHRNDVLHRDIKPENILLAEGHAIVADFGIAQAICASCGDNITLPGHAVGTPGYMSPEQAVGDQTDTRTDVYSLGSVLYEMLAGTSLYQGQSAHATLARQAVEPVPSLTQLRRDERGPLEVVVKKALAKVPADRYQTVAEFADALRGLGQVSVVNGSGLADVEVAPPRRGRTRHKIGGLLAALLALAGVGWSLSRASGEGPGRIQSLAVLPLANLSGDAEQEYFVEGMHDALITELAEIGALKVISRTSVLRYRGTDKSVPEIARELNVDAVVEGSVFRVGDTVRIVAQLADAVLDRNLWAQTYDGDLRNVLAFQSEVARDIAREVEAELTPREAARLVTVRLVDPEVHDAYLRGRFHHAKGTVAGVEKAIEYYEVAIQRDPTFAPAYSALALSIHLFGVYGGAPPHDTEPRAKAAAQRALELDEGLAEARAVLAGIRSMFDWDWTGAEREYRAALQIDPNSTIAHQWYAYHLSAVGRHDEAVSEARRGLDLDPLNPMARVVLADQFVYARRYDRAIGELERAVEMDGSFNRACERLEWIYARLGRYVEAVAMSRARMSRAGSHPDTEAAVAALEGAYATEGPRGYWRWRLRELNQAAAGGYVAPSEFAAVYAALGEEDSAFDWLERAYQERDGAEMLNVWPGYDPLRSDPRFNDLLRRMNFPS